MLVSTAWYKAVILGEYWGEALLSVSEPNNESFYYQSSDDENEETPNSTSSVGFPERDIQDQQIINKDLVANPEMLSSNKS